MKILRLFCLVLLLPVGLFATDRAVDGDGNIPGSFPTIQAAVAAAVDGDRIVIYEANRYYSGNITLDKSLVLMPASAGDYWYHTGDILVTPANGREVTISGVNLLGGIFSNGNNGVGARCEVNIVDIFLKGIIDFDEDNYRVNVLYSRTTRYVRFRNGSMIGSEINSLVSDGSPYSGRLLHIPDESATFGVGDTVKIIGNIIADYQNVSGANAMLNFANSSARYFIANNFVFTSISSIHYAVRVDTVYMPDSLNAFFNNTVTGDWGNVSGCPGKTGSMVWLIGTTDDLVQNNILASDNTNTGCTLGGLSGRFNIFAGFVSSPGRNLNDNIPMSYFQLDIDPETGFPITAAERELLIDKGNQNSGFLDLDLSRNDIGIEGGPYSWWNYHTQDSTGNAGRARIFDLELPSRIYNLGTGTKVKAKAAHMK